MNNIKRIGLLLIVVAFSITSCNTDKVVSSSFIQQKKYTQGYYTSSFAKSKKVRSCNEYKTETENFIPVGENALTEEQSNVTASANNDIGTYMSVNTLRKDYKKIKKDFKHKMLEGECDVITLKSGDEIKAKVLEITQTEIKYKKCDNINGPTISLNKADIFMIKYANGTKEMITTKETKNNSNAEKKNNSQRTSSNDGNEISGLAIASFILGLLWVLVSLLPYMGILSTASIGLSIIALISGILAFILGLSALSRIKNDNHLGGKGFAIAGVVLGALYLLILIITIVAIIAFLL